MVLPSNGWSSRPDGYGPASADTNDSKNAADGKKELVGEVPPPPPRPRFNLPMTPHGRILELFKDLREAFHQQMFDFPRAS